MDLPALRETLSFDMSQAYTSPAIKIDGRANLSNVYTLSGVSVGGSLILFASNASGTAGDGNAITRWYSVKSTSFSSNGVTADKSISATPFYWIQFVYTPGSSAAGLMYIDFVAS